MLGEALVETREKERRRARLARRRRHRCSQQGRVVLQPWAHDKKRMLRIAPADLGCIGALVLHPERSRREGARQHLHRDLLFLRRAPLYGYCPI